jgi:hypothetical protein
VRGTVKAFGERLPAAPSCSFHRHAAAALSPALQPVVAGVLATLTTLTEQIRTAERRLATLARTHFPETTHLRQVPGVGPVTALAFVLTVEDPHRFRASRSVGAYLGLCSRRDQSSERDPQLRISKAGDPFVRRLLVTAAQYILGPFGADTDLRRWGLALAAQGGKYAKRRAVVAVATPRCSTTCGSPARPFNPCARPTARARRDSPPDDSAELTPQVGDCEVRLDPRDRESDCSPSCGPQHALRVRMEACRELRSPVPRSPPRRPPLTRLAFSWKPDRAPRQVTAKRTADPILPSTTFPRTQLCNPLNLRHCGCRLDPRPSRVNKSCNSSAFFASPCFVDFQPPGPQSDVSRRAAGRSAS